MLSRICQFPTDSSPCEWIDRLVGTSLCLALLLLSIGTIGTFLQLLSQHFQSKTGWTVSPPLYLFYTATHLTWQIESDTIPNNKSDYRTSRSGGWTGQSDKLSTGQWVRLFEIFFAKSPRPIVKLKTIRIRSNYCISQTLSTGFFQSFWQYF